MQVEGSEVYNIVAFAFVGQDTAGEIMNEVKSSGALAGYEVVAQAVVEQDPSGKVHVHEPGHGGVGAAFGAFTGGVLGLIGGPAGVLALAAAGAAMGGAAGHYWGRVVPEEDLKELGEALTPNSSAFLLLLEDMYSEMVLDRMSRYNAKVVTLTVGDDLSGEIASLAAGKLADDAGTTVVAAGERTVAAGSEGNIAAASAVTVAEDEADDSGHGDDKS